MWRPIETAPKTSEARDLWGNEYFWLYCPIDGVFVGHRGMGSDEWYLCDGRRTWAVSHWQPYTPPAPPTDERN